MKPANSPLLRLCFSLGLLLFLSSFADNYVWAQASSTAQTLAENRSDDAEEAPSLLLTLNMDGNDSVKVMFDFKSSLEQKYNFQRLLSTVLGCPLRDISLSRDEERENTMLYAECDLPLRKSRFTRIGVIDLQPLRNIQKVEPKLKFVLILSIPPPDVFRCDPVPEQVPQNPVGATCFYFSTDLAHTPATVQFEFGYSSKHVIRNFGILGFLLLMPIGLTFWFRRRASSAPDEAKPTVWFAYRRFLMWTALVGTLVWWAALDLTQADEFVKFLLLSWQWNDAFAAAIFPWVLLWIPPLVIYFLCLALSLPIQTLRGTKHTQRQILNQSFWAIARFVLPLALIGVGVAEMSNSLRLAVLLIAAGIVAGRFASVKFVRAYGIELHALTSGELRDRAFAMADKANARLNQLYVIPTEHIRMANAFAHVAQNVLLTDYLVKNLSKAEVDAVVGHELAHLQNKHLGRRMIVIFIAIIVFAFCGGLLEYWLPTRLPNGPIFYTLLLLTLFFISRRNEFAADAGSVKLTGNAEAMMTALARLTHLNTMPLEWSKVDEKLLTHPSTLRRIRRLATDAGISEARTAELLNQSVAAPGETYPIPPTALPAGKLFSTRYKTQVAGKFAWTVVLTTVVIPAIVAFLARSGHLEGGMLWIAYSGGFLLTIMADFALLNFLPMVGLPKMERLLREKFQVERTLPADRGSLFVSLAPDSCPRVYEGNWAWDLGFVSLGGGQLSYWGEEARFTLRREEITSLSIGPGPTGWFRTTSVYVSWRDSAGREGTFNLRPLCARSMRDMAVKTRQVARDLENWHRRLPPSTNPLIAPAEADGEKRGAPSFGQVTGNPPQLLVRGQSLVRDFLLNTFLALGVILVFGLGFPPIDELGRPSNSTDVNPSLGGLYVLLVVWLARVFVFLPFWRARPAVLEELGASTRPQL